MTNSTGPIDTPWQTLLNTIPSLSSDDRQRLWRIVDDEFSRLLYTAVVSLSHTPRGALRVSCRNYGRKQSVLPAPGSSVWISFQAPSRLAQGLQVAAQDRQTSIDTFLNELLSTSLAILQIDLPPIMTSIIWQCDAIWHPPASQHWATSGTIR